MSRHVAPSRLADLAAGRLGGAAAARARRHLDACPACHAAWHRVKAARAAFVDLGSAPAPELRWDRVRTQIYREVAWSKGAAGSAGAAGAAGSGASPAAATSRRSWAWRAAPALAVAAAAAAVVWWAPWRAAHPGAPTPAAAHVPVTPPARPEVASPDPSVIPVELAPAPWSAVVTLIEGDAALAPAGASGPGDEEVDPDVIGARAIGAGARLRTGDGRLALQLGPQTVVTLGPRSTLELVRLDAAAVTLAVDGQLDLEVARRAAGQRFVVAAGERSIEVRGTAFRVVHHDGALAVACEHGRVVVQAGDAAVEVGAGQGLTLDADAPVLGRAPRSLGDDELAALVATRAAPVPVWLDADTALRTTAPLAILAPRARAVKVDGVVIGRGPVWMRVSPGRHLVEAELAPGRFSPARWVEVDGTTTRPVTLTAAEPDEPPPVGGPEARRARRAELARALDQGRLRTCVRALDKQGIAAGTHVELEIGVDAAGAIRFLNIADTSLPARAAACVRDAVAAARLGAGVAASWRHRVTF